MVQLLLRENRAVILARASRGGCLGALEVCLYLDLSFGQDPVGQLAVLLRSRFVAALLVAEQPQGL